jgi:hypothetical protein
MDRCTIIGLHVVTRRSIDGTRDREVGAVSHSSESTHVWSVEFLTVDAFPPWHHLFILLRDLFGSKLETNKRKNIRVVHL